MEQWEADLTVDKMQQQKFMKDNVNNYVNHDNNSDLRLRMAVITNSKVPVAENKDPLDMTQTLNQSRGSVAISYMNGVSGTGPAAGTDIQTSQYIKSNNSYKLADRKFNYDTTSTDANTKLSMPYIWTGQNSDGENTWCGFNYVPLQNSIALMGNKESGQPLILNYVPSNPEILLPALKPGEIAISGYGHNYIHWGQSDKITIHCDSKQGGIDYDDPNYLDPNTNIVKKNAADSSIDIQINANDRMILIETKENGQPNNTYNMYNSNTRQPNGNQVTKILITPTDIDIITNGDTNNNNTGATHINISDEGIITEVSDNDSQTYIQQTSNCIKQKYMDDKYQIEQELNENSIHRKVQDLKNINKFTEEYIDSENYSIHTTNYHINAEHINMMSDTVDNDIIINADTYTVNGNEINLKSEDTIDINVPYGTHKEGSNQHEEEYTEGKRAGQQKKFKININGCNVKIDANTGEHGSIL